MEEPRLPAHLEVAALIRRTQAAGGFGAVLAKGEHDAGTILVVLLQGGENARLFERMPQPDGTRPWVLVRTQSAENMREFDEYLTRRRARDDDIWIIELDIAEGERLVLNLHYAIDSAALHNRPPGS